MKANTVGIGTLKRIILQISAFTFKVLAYLTLVFTVGYFLYSFYLILENFVSLVLVNPLVAFFDFILNHLSLFFEVLALSFSIYTFISLSGAIKDLHVRKIPHLKIVDSDLPSVSLIIPTFNTEPLVLEETIKGIERIEYPQLQVILADNSTDEEVTIAIKQICTERAWDFVSKKDQKGFKAGVLNFALPHTKGEFIVILDSDHIPEPSIVMKMVQRLQENPKAAYVQAKTTFRNADALHRKANLILHSQFFEVYQRSKHHLGMTLFSGTTGCIRKEILVNHGGFREETFIEDIDTSILFLTRGFEGIFLDEYGSRGLTPESPEDHLKQLWRWSRGAGEIIRRRSIEIFRSQLSFGKKFDLFFSPMLFLAILSPIAISFIAPLILLLIEYTEFPFSMSRPMIFGTSLLWTIPVLLGFSLFSVIIVTLLLEEKRSSLFRRILDLPAFYIYSVAAYPLLVPTFFQGFVGIKSDSWEPNVKARRNSSVLFLIGIAFLMATYLLVMKNNPFALLTLAPGLCFLVPLPLILYYRIMG